MGGDERRTLRPRSQCRITSRVIRVSAPLSVGGEAPMRGIPQCNSEILRLGRPGWEF